MFRKRLKQGIQTSRDGSRSGNTAEEHHACEEGRRKGGGRSHFASSSASFAASSSFDSPEYDSSLVLDKDIVPHIRTVGFPTNFPLGPLSTRTGGELVQQAAGRVRSVPGFRQRSQNLRVFLDGIIEFLTV